MATPFKILTFGPTAAAVLTAKKILTAKQQEVAAAAATAVQLLQRLQAMRRAVTKTKSSMTHHQGWVFKAKTDRDQSASADLEAKNPRNTKMGKI
jgi:hypothetical protein